MGLLTLSGAGCTMLRPACETPANAEPVRSAACVVVADGRLLVIRHRFGGLLGLPGGTAHRGEAGTCTAERETWEETGYAVRAVERIGPRNAVSPVFRCELLKEPQGTDPPSRPLRALPEVLGIYWLEPGELDASDWRSPAQLDWLPAVVERLGSPISSLP
jgi:8-oxo-dGTP diphosphatase